MFSQMIERTGTQNEQRLVSKLLGTVQAQVTIQEIYKDASPEERQKMLEKHYRRVVEICSLLRCERYEKR